MECEMYRRIIVPVDGSDLAEQVVPHVEALAKAFGAHVTVLWVTAPVATVAGVPVASEERWQAEDDELAQPYLDRLEQRFQAAGVGATVDRANGVPANVIVERATESETDLIAMTTHGRSGIQRLALGSVAEEVVRHANCPVLLVRAK
jgi:nucleotide-binding universal stress UspA family protein